METSKWTMLQTLAVVACLSLFLLYTRYAPEPADSHENPAPSQGAIAATAPTSALTARVSSNGTDPTNSASPHEPPTTGAGPPPARLERFVFYPELHQIEQSASTAFSAALVELAPLTNHADPVIRLAAIEAIAQMKIEEIPLPVIGALRDPDPLVRIAALDALAWRRDPASVQLAEPLLFDRDREVRLAAVDTLAQLKGTQAVIALSGVITDGDTGIRRRAVNALGEIGGETAIHLLRQALYDIDASVRTNALEILRELEEARP